MNLVDYRFTRNLLWLINIDLIFTSFLGVIDRYRGLSTSVTDLFKITVVIEVAYVLYFILLKKRELELHKFISGAFIIFLFVGAVVGMMFSQINTKFISHIFEYVMPVLIMGVSRVVKDSVGKNPDLLARLEKIVILNSYIYIFCVVLFRVMYEVGLANYNAYGAGTIDFIAPFLLFALDKPIVGFAVVGAGVLSGKRAVLVKIIVLVLIYYFTKQRSWKKKLRDIIIIAIGLAAVIYLFNTTNYFDRILLTINNLFGEEKNLELATGGRVSEIDIIVSLMNASPFTWITGHGFGVFIECEEGIIRHYSHFTPLAYTMISGVIFAGIMYIWMIVNSIRLMLIRNQYYRMFGAYLLMIVVGSTMGASILNEPKYWLIFGCASSMLYQSKGFITFGKKHVYSIGGII